MPREFLCRIFKRGFDAFAQFLARTFERRLGSFVENLLSDSNARDYCRRVRVFLSPSRMYMVLYFPACPLRLIFEIFKVQKSRWGYEF